MANRLGGETGNRIPLKTVRSKELEGSSPSLATNFWMGCSNGRALVCRTSELRS